MNINIDKIKNNINNKRIAVIIAAFLLLIGGGIALYMNQERSPIETVEGFHKAAQDGDIEETKKYIDPAILQQFETGQVMWSGTYGNWITEYRQKFKTVEPIEDTLKINGDIATMEVKITGFDNSKATEEYKLIKEKGDWKITD